MSKNLWADSLAYPAYAACVSSISLLGEVARPYIRKSQSYQKSSSPPSVADVDSTEESFSLPLLTHAGALGGYSICGGRILQLLASLALLGLSIASYVAGNGNSTGLDAPNESAKSWLQFVSCLTYGYTTILALLSVSMTTGWSKVAAQHFVVVMLLSFAVYACRDIYPLTTYTRTPIDIGEGWILWARIALLGLASVVIPLAMPRLYDPFDPEDLRQPIPEQTASLLSFFTFSFMNPVITAAGKVRHLPYTQLPALADDDEVENLIKDTLPLLDPLSPTRSGKVFWGLLRIFYWEHILECVMLIVKCLTLYVSPYAIGQLLNYLEDGGANATVKPWFWIAALFCGPAIGSVAVQWFGYITVRVLVLLESWYNRELNAPRMKTVIAVRTEAIITALVFEHSLRIRVKAESNSGPGSTNNPASSDNGHLLGNINNLVTSDLSNITDGRNFLLLGLYSPLQVVLSIWFLYNILEWSAFVGMAIMIILFPLPGYIAKKLHAVQVEAMKRSDARIETVTEILNVLRMIKLFGWEGKMGEKLAAKREEELKWILRRQILWLLNGIINYLIPLFYMMATYATYTVVMHRSLSASIVFPSMTVFEMLRLQLYTVFHWTPVFIQAKISLDRIDNYLHTAELLDMFSPTIAASTETSILTPASGVIGFHDAKFTWTGPSIGGPASPAERRFELAIDDLRFEKGQINLISGPTGSGKTSMLMALLGEMHFTPATSQGWFNLPRDKAIAYVPQESWVLNDTIKNNILFGSPYDEERYNQVIYQCCLERDLGLFDAADETEVGEKGVTLSGGQKARITLARAVYSVADILLLDDVLAALDVHTSKWIVGKCFQGSLMRGRTILLVTHNVPLAAPAAKFAVSLGAGGRILSQGPASDLVGQVSVTNPQALAPEKHEDMSTKTAEASGQLTADEELVEGRIAWSSLKMYLSGFSGSWPVIFWIMVLGSLLARHTLNTAQTWFLGYWAQQYDTRPAKDVAVSWYLAIYCIIVALTAVSAYITRSTYFRGSIRASRRIHHHLMQSVLHTTLRWLDETPTSRIMTRCTQDIRTIDGPMVMVTSDFAENAVSMLLKFLAISFLIPAFMVPGLLAAILGSKLGQTFLKVQLAIKRELSAARSPVVGHFTAATAGVVSIRAYKAQAMYQRQLFNRINRYTRVARSFNNLSLWVSLRMDLLGALLTSALAAYLVYGKQTETASNAGFSLNMAVSFSELILWTITQFNQFLVQGNSIERIQQYLQIEQEPQPVQSRTPPAYWPSSGELKVENLHARYSPEGPDVLHGISFHVRPGERIGIVGRTGSGKSSLMLSILRCIITTGDVYYDGIRIDSINLDNLRSNMTIIPQVPELLSGSLRENLDPFSEHDDATLNDALRDAGLFNIQRGDGKNDITLDTQILSGGTNLSTGQRQIVALARAIIRRSKLLFLDEATSAVDYDTEAVIQSSLRTKLRSDVTVITIAHRLQTVMDADMIIVLDAGHIALNLSHRWMGATTEPHCMNSWVMEALAEHSDSATRVISQLRRCDAREDQARATQLSTI
ncbi:P-loop containing nucleoside triphosphate hydrolase protein [Heliocybe sulcata]|uniref:P-loop containing nucleoside triphosphate hydrolase protein n=1 Tax=Heliocybe sulcata TaxID=5364 RepID=A0A5C3NHC5_9AGAM|nr:P-loop containing nucleoside triphosphate hydrolase protein [Heliocybe sulcata]